VGRKSAKLVTNVKSASRTRRPPGLPPPRSADKLRADKNRRGPDRKPEKMRGHTTGTGADPGRCGRAAADGTGILVHP